MSTNNELFSIALENIKLNFVVHDESFVRRQNAAGREAFIPMYIMRSCIPSAMTAACFWRTVNSC